MASTEGMVPITRNFLASYYDKYPFPPLSDDVQLLCSQIRSLCSDLLSNLAPNEVESELLELADRSPPHKVDENIWRNREHMEEIVFLLERPHWPIMLRQKSRTELAELASFFDKLRGKFEKTFDMLLSFQAKNSERVFNIVMTYMPQDFRGTIIRQQRDRSERNKQAEVDSLVNSGGTIREKYALLWKQQMNRRIQLAQLGSATGVYKTIVKYLVGVPQVLLDFVKQINDDDGPMEEQRQRYGPPLYRLTSMVLSIRLFLSLYWRRFESRKLESDEISILEQAVNVYASELERFITLASEVFANSPFFISAEEAGAIDARKNDDFKEISIAAGKTYEVSLTVDSLNSYIAWDFALQGKLTLDIGFSVECINPSGKKTSILPYRRYEADQGNFCTCVAGNYKLIWDNTYSTFFKKALKYKVDCIPPVVEPAQSTAEMEG